MALGEALKTNRALTTLHIETAWSDFSDAAVMALCEALKTNRTLTTLSIEAGGHSRVLSDGAGRALGEALKTNSTLTTLDVGRPTDAAVGSLSHPRR